jgi:hypothetical protein
VKTKLLSFITYTCARNYGARKCTIVPQFVTTWGILCTPPEASLSMHHNNNEKKEKQRSEERKGYLEYGAKRAKRLLNRPSHGVTSLPNGAKRLIVYRLSGGISL